jgi:hypothetical protein
MRFLFLTLYGGETDFYGRVSRELVRRGHEAVHVTWSRRGAQRLGRMGLRAHVLPDLLAATGPGDDLAAEGSRLEERYAMRSLRDVYRTDWRLAGRPERKATERTVRHFLALERVFDDERPEVVVPEVGSETMRTAAHLIALQRGIRTLFLFYTIFPDPLRLYRDTVHAPIVPSEELRALTGDERAQIEGFVAAFIERDRPIREYRRPRVHAGTLRDFAGHIARKALWDRDNEYLRPHLFVRNYFREKARARVAQRFYEPLGDAPRPFVYFPLHVVDDYKIKRVIPHCYDQAAIIELIAESLPQGVDLVLKEHPLSVGRNPPGLLRRLSSRPEVRIVTPFTSSHELIRRAQAVAVISSTVGLEALLHGRPVLTCGQPFYAGYGITVDVDSFRELPDAVTRVLRFQPDRERTLRFLAAAMRACLPGQPALADASEENAVVHAASLDAAVADLAARRPLASA